jgi:hypothetical protein
MERAGYPRPNAERVPAAQRLGGRALAPNDARLRLDRIHEAEAVEAEGPPGPKCFTRRILDEQPPPNFQLSRNAKTYNGKSPPAEWLEDYIHLVHIARGNKRWAVRYVPQMLEGVARSWLNSLPEGSINNYLEFQDAFVSHFTTMCDKPKRAVELSVCKQLPGETDGDYSTR